MLIVGCGALIQGILRLGKPAQTVEKSGWLYHQQFVDQGTAVGMIALGVVALLIGAVMFNNTWIRSIRSRKHL